MERPNLIATLLEDKRIHKLRILNYRQKLQAPPWQKAAYATFQWLLKPRHDISARTLTFVPMIWGIICCFTNTKKANDSFIILSHNKQCRGFRHEDERGEDVGWWFRRDPEMKDGPDLCRFHIESLSLQYANLWKLSLALDWWLMDGV